MSKYDFEVDLSQNSSTGIILNKLKKGSVVLEFGCATGRMTRYMKEALGCQVYIVEYDKGAYETAKKYAEDGLCDDILTFQWAERFKGTKFDAILFADVLEHLTQPEKVLERASELLKDDGYIYVSVPNITHNDILLKAYGERFDYTPTGLLDDTHVHFWGLKNLEPLAEQTGLHIESVEGTYCATGHTEQFEHRGKDKQLLLENILKERSCGEVYQFVVTLRKRDGLDAAYTLRKPSIQSHIYLDTGNDFNANEIIAFDAVYTGHGSYAASYVIDDPGKLKRVRFDPVELQGCILRNVSISQGAQRLQLMYHNGVEVDTGFLLLGGDPMVYAEVLSNEEPVVIDAEIVLWGETFLKAVQEAYVNRCAAFAGLREEFSNLTLKTQQLQSSNEYLSGEITQLQGSLACLTQEKAQLCGRIEALQGSVEHLSGENRALQGRIDHLSGEKEALGRDLGAYIILANRKDDYALSLEREIKRLSDENVALLTDVNAYVALTQQKNDYISALEREVHYYQNLRVVRLRAYIVRILKGVKRRLKRIMRKEEH